MNNTEKNKIERRKDEKFNRAMSDCRVRKIFDFLDQGTPTSQIIDKLDKLPKIRPEIRCEESIKNVKESLSIFPFIDKIKKTSHQSFEDRRLKYDLIVNLFGRSLDSVGIQVKSSDLGISKFYKQINPKNLDLKSILIKRKLVVLNGQDSQEDITNNFLEQFTVINDFYLNNPKN